MQDGNGRTSFDLIVAKRLSFLENPLTNA